MNPANMGQILDGTVMAGLQQRGRLSYSNGFGFAVFGESRFGDSRMMGGIYQKRSAGYNQFTGPPPQNAEVIYVKMRSYRPTNPQTTAQQAQRQKLIDGWVAWGSLTNEEKTVYNQRANRKGRFGCYLFMSEYLKSH